MLSGIWIYLSDGAGMTEYFPVCAGQGVWSTSFEIACGDFSVPSLSGRKHASELISAILSLFFFPKLALNYLNQSGLL